MAVEVSVEKLHVFFFFYAFNLLKAFVDALCDSGPQVSQYKKHGSH